MQESSESVLLCVLRPLEDQLGPGVTPQGWTTLDVFCPPAPAACPPLLGRGAWPWGASLEEGGGSTVGLACVGPALVSTEGAAICFLYRGRKAHRGRPVGPETPTKPELVWNPVPSLLLTTLPSPACQAPATWSMKDRCRCMVAPVSSSAAAAAGPAPLRLFDPPKGEVSSCACSGGRSDGDEASRVRPGCSGWGPGDRRSADGDVTSASAAAPSPASSSTSSCGRITDVLAQTQAQLCSPPPAWAACERGCVSRPRVAR